MFQTAGRCLPFFFFLFFLLFLVFFCLFFFLILFFAELYTDTMRFAEGNISDQISVILRAGTHGGSSGSTVRQHRRDPPLYTDTPPAPLCSHRGWEIPIRSPRVQAGFYRDPAGGKAWRWLHPPGAGSGGPGALTGSGATPVRPRSAPGAASSADPSLAAGRVPAGATPAASAGRMEVSTRDPVGSEGIPHLPPPPITGHPPGTQRFEKGFDHHSSPCLCSGKV